MAGRDAKPPKPTIPTLDELLGISEHQKKENRGPGKPTKYRVDMCHELPRLFAKGESVAEVCAMMDIGRTTFYDWVERYPKFRRAYDVGAFLSEAWWCALGRAAAAGTVEINGTAWVFNMKNRFRWRDKPDPEQIGDDEMTPEDWARAAHDALAEMEEMDHGGPGASYTDITVDPAHTTH